MFDVRVYEGDSDGKGVVHAAHRDALGNFTACARDADEPAFFETVPDAAVTCLTCLVRGGRRIK